MFKNSKKQTLNNGIIEEKNVVSTVFGESLTLYNIK